MSDTPIDMGMVDAVAPASVSPPARSAPAPVPAPSPRPSAPENPRSRGWSPALERRAAGAGPTAPAAAEAGANVPDPEAPPVVDQTKHKIGKFEVTETEIGELMADKAQRDLAAATRPATPDAYELKLPEGTTLPGNVAVQFDANDPGLIAARNWAHARGIDQRGFSEVLSIYAAHVAQQEANFAAARQAEIAKLGATGPQRVDAITQWLRAEVGDADAKPILATIATAAHVRMFERVMNKIASQGTASFSQSHRVAAPEADKIPGYDTMSFAQRRAAQDALNARRG